MTRISTITLTEQPEQHVLTIRTTIDFMKDFEGFCEQAYSKIIDYLNQIDILLGGEPFVCFHNTDLENLDVEVGFPVAKYVDGIDEIKATILPSQKVVSAIDLGPYEKQDPTLEEIFAWIEKNHHEVKNKIYYYYLNDTKRSSSDFLTRMVVPVK